MRHEMRSQEGQQHLRGAVRDVRQVQDDGVPRQGAGDVALYQDFEQAVRREGLRQVLAPIVAHIIRILVQEAVQEAVSGMAIPDLRISVSAMLSVRFRQISRTRFGIIFYRDTGANHHYLVERVECETFYHSNRVPRWLFSFHLQGGTKWGYTTLDMNEASHISRFIHETNTPLVATSHYDEMAQYKPSANKVAKPVCEECYGTGFKFGFGAPCSKRCKP